jgi:hypothetical protein
MKPVFSTLSPCTQTISKLWRHLDSLFRAIEDLKKVTSVEGPAGAECVCESEAERERDKQSYETAEMAVISNCTF